MKIFFYSFLLLVLFASCKRGAGESSNTERSITGKKISQTDSLIKEFKSIIQGAWVNKAYIKQIAKTMSPYLAKDKVGEITTLLIDVKHIENDSIKIDAGYGNHEGGNFTLKFHPGKTKGSIIAYSSLGKDIEGRTFELAYKIDERDTTLILYTFNSHGKLIDTTSYIRVFNNVAGHELGFATYYTVNKTLISGNYILTDTNGKQAKVSFDNYGNVIGFRGANTYAIDVDFETPLGNNMDQIDFDRGGKNNLFYAFKIKKDTLNLYQTSFDKDSINLILGKRVYQLITQR